MDPWLRDRYAGTSEHRTTARNRVQRPAPTITRRAVRQADELLAETVREHRRTRLVRRLLGWAVAVVVVVGACWTFVHFYGGGG